jgi:type I restriction enzyme M protein
LLQRDKISLDLTWLRDDALEDMDNLPPPEVIAQEIVEDLEAAVAEFSAIAESLASAAGVDCGTKRPTPTTEVSSLSLGR